MKHIIRTMMLLVALMMGATNTAWAQDTPTLSSEDIKINKFPKDILNTDGTVKEVVGGKVSAFVDGRVVTLTITEKKSGYDINKNMITVEPMISADLARRRSESVLANTITVDGSGDTYTFTLPEKYSGANVTVRFFKTAAEGVTQIFSLSELSSTGRYELVCDVDASNYTTIATFTGTLTGQAKDDGTFPVIRNLKKPLFTTATGATISNIMLQQVSISQAGYVGAICGTANGTTRIYNCGILPTTLDNASFRSTVESTGHHCGSLVGFLDENARVINCFSYADVSAPNSNSRVAAGIVGYNNVSTTMTNLKTMVMNCMFYGNITGASAMKPVYGGKLISNAGETGVNGYNYYRNGTDVTFDDDYANFNAYYCTLPADEEYLTRFEYYRSILNSNKKLCTWWINGTSETAPTDADVEAVGIAKWVLDPSIAPYPILKKWGKYPSVINKDKDYVWNPITKSKISRAAAEPYHGKQLGTISVTVEAGVKYSGSEATSTKILSSVVVMDMDTLNHDYCYAKIQLPYYNELFGDPSVVIPAATATDYTSKWKQRYGGNYTDYVVTGWKIKTVTGGEQGSFKGYAVASNGAVSADAVIPDDTSESSWEDGFNFADRNCTNKDLYSKSGRVFAQGGYYYVPEGVTEITIEAYWGKAVYLHNKEHSLDRVNVASGADGAAAAEYGTAFSPTGTLSDTFQGQTVQTTLQDAISQLTKSASLTVYDQAIVLVGNVQVKNRSESVGRDKTASNSRPFTIMSIDEDMDNEPDYCLELQFRQKTDRPAIHPVRFDFLPVPELGLAIKTNQNAYAIGVFIPQGHFEITETSFMHTTQFEYDGDVGRVESPIILNGGHFEQIVVRYCNGNKDKVSYFLLGGHFRIKRFTPGHHASNNTANATVRHCVVNAIGGDFPELYLSGIYQPGLAVRADNPHCYINGGRFGTVAGAGYEQVNGNVTFKIDHAIIEKFYGGGMNGAKPVTGNIDVTINNSIVYDIFCGGPMVGKMTKPDDGTRKTVMTTAENTIFDKYFGGGNGGTSYYREQKFDNDVSWPSDWTANTYKFPDFNPLNTVSGKTKQYNTDKGYHDMFEFEVFNSSNGLNANCVARTFIQWAQFGTTITGTVTNTLTNCTVEHDFYGGGNLGTVDGDVISTLTNTHVKGSVFGGGYSAEIPRFRMHDVNKVHAPHRDKAGLIDEQGYLEYVQDSGKDRYYRWTNDKNNNTASTNAPTYWSEADGEYKCYTPISLAGLGEVSGSVTLTINGTSQIDGNVYGGGDESAVKGATNILVTESAVIGGNAANSGDVYGGGNVANVDGDTKVLLLGGTVNGDVYGGGKGRLEKGAATDPDYVSPIAATVGSTKVNLNGIDAADYKADYTTLERDGEGDDASYVVKDSEKGCIVKGSIFGCNNLNGTPKGLAKVHVYKTQNAAATRITNPAEGEKTAKVDGRYDVKAVYGGGNLAPYEPTNSDKKYDTDANKAILDAIYAEVIIDGCGRTSIGQVYGGGNAASSPATKVDVNGTYEIGELFGGGNGKDDISKDGGVTWIANPGANVGYRAYEDDADNADTPAKRELNYGYGSGKAEVNIYGGKIHSIYGGSNTKGNVRRIAVAMLEELQGSDNKPKCAFNVDEAYGGGKSATMDGEAHLEMRCIPGLKAAYGGAENADIQNNVTINITNGKFSQVFGGNNMGGRIMGGITVNVEETGCRPVIIGELYGGGNRASYSVYGYKPETDEDGIVYDEFDKIRWLPLVKDESITVSGETYTALTEKYPYPQVNVKSFTSIGEVYGGGYGTTATMVGDPHVNINVAMGDKTNHAEAKIDAEGILTIIDETEDHVETTREVKYPTHTQGKIGAIRNVFGGGNAARVVGDTYVIIGTQEYVKIETLKEGDSVKGYYKKVNDTFTVCDDADTAEEDETYYKAVIGADIRGNVYGGGNKAEVTGSTSVTIGKQTTP